MRIHVVNKFNQILYPELLDEFFKARHEIYVEEKGWREASSDGREVDQFDTPDAVYLIGTQDGRVITGTRLTRCDQPTMMGTVFNLPYIQSKNVAEWTRGFIVKEYREKGHGPIKGQFCGTVMEYCLKHGITMIGGLQDVYWLPLWKRFGWTVTEYGPRLTVDGRECVVAYFDVTEEARTNALKRGGMTPDQSILIERYI